MPSVNYAMAIARIGEEESESGPSGFEMQNANALIQEFTHRRMYESSFF